MRNTKTIKYNGIKCTWDGRYLDFSDALNYVEERQALVPAHLEVCEDCGGRGTTTAHIECDGGGFTSSEWAEACDGDPDFAEDYFGGKYDRPCPECNGANVVPVPDEGANPEVMTEIWEKIQGERDYQAARAEERRVGA